ncbi:hypothetical protein BURPS1710A_A1051 [Burkholderia pseudomallei 1710a]|uniref:Uncharacterized protein n=1 Tax=Burkholderia pseudomallei 1710a TaxID=320371 RepID=A0A0E1VZW6_BURPE|nr:hypothetical protein BURPS1710A_A1051 [Burkholderia pseudomallei 1710a]
MRACRTSRSASKQRSSPHLNNPLNYIIYFYIMNDGNARVARSRRTIRTGPLSTR